MSLEQNAATGIQINDAADFDNKIFEIIDSIINDCKPLSKSANVARCSCIANNFNVGSPWPVNNTYASMDLLVALFSMLNVSPISEEKAQSMKLDETSLALFYPSLLNHLLPAEKLRTIVHMPAIKSDESVLQVNTAELTKLPNWSILVNVMGHGIKYQDKDVAGISFTRAFFGTVEMPDGQEVPEELMGTVAVAGEPNSVMNSMSTLIFYTNGMMDIGPNITIDETITIGKAIENTANLMFEDSSWQEGYTPEEAKAEIESNANFLMLASSYLMYVLNHQNELKDADGSPAAFAPNPEPSLMPDSNEPLPLIANASSVTKLYLS